LLVVAVAVLGCCHVGAGVASAADEIESAPFAPQAVTFAGDDIAWAEVVEERRRIVVDGTAAGLAGGEELVLPLLKYREGDAFLSVLAGRPGAVAMQAGVAEFFDLGYKSGQVDGTYHRQFESTGGGFSVLNEPCRNVERGAAPRLDMSDRWVVREAPECGEVQARRVDTGQTVALPFTSSVTTGGDWFLGRQFVGDGSDLVLADAAGGEVARLSHHDLGGTLLSFDVAASGLAVAAVGPAPSRPSGSLAQGEEKSVVTLTPDGRSRRFALPDDTTTAEVRAGDSTPVLLRTTGESGAPFPTSEIRALDATIEVLDPATGRRRVIGRRVVDIGAGSSRPRSFDARGDQVLWVQRACGEVRFVRGSVQAATAEDEGSLSCPLELNARPRKRSDRVTLTTSCRGLPRSCSLVTPEIRSVGRKPFTVARTVPGEPEAGIALTQRGRRLGRGQRTVRVRVSGRMQAYAQTSSDDMRVSRVVDMVLPR
jgi:hypothetical protein